MTSSDPPAFSLDYKLTRGDVMAAGRALAGVQDQSRLRWKRFGLMLLMLAGFLLLAGGSDPEAVGRVVRRLLTGEAGVLVYALLAFAVIAVMGRPLARLWLWLSYLQAGRSVDSSLRLDDEGVTTSTSDMRSTLMWKAVEGVIETPRHAFIFASRRQMPVIVPRRAVDNDLAWRFLLTFISAQVRLARAANGPPPA